MTFTNTKIIPATCPRTHSDEAKQVYYESVSSNPEISLLNEHLRSLENHLEEKDKRIEQGRIWMATQTGDNLEALENEIIQIELDTAKYEKQIHTNDFTPNQRIQNQLIENQKRLQEQLRQLSVPPTENNEQELNICDTDGCFLKSNMTDKEMAQHVSSPVHQAYIKIQSKTEAIRQQLTNRPTIKF
ncbi:uncharacterized protein BX664DRAFT_195716 [Halteromyces radiatus]|uniref:uncharacterized protein n=1 Tax=Halteromyces radiatus TaxID=101107 RepID=UPI00221EB29D|nr:uncharacterized protein BX664DRAFT_195716 [Halteromyces radiatus]KAI8081534.1 hypothetical protein BX664DRAFT_195716 [Halteromyces radiatus]